MNEKYTIRNHRSVVVKNVIIASFLILLALAWVLPEYPLISSVAMVLLIAVSSAVFYIYWSRTLITFMPEEIVVERNTLFKIKKTIPYVKIASVSADRDIIDRIFGTTKLKININSSKSAGMPDLTLTLRSDIAESVRMELSKGIFRETYETTETEGPVAFSKKEIIIHGLFSLSVYQTMFALILIIYSLAVIIFTERGISGILVALVLLVLTEIIPMILLIIRYYDFNVFRIGDTIHIKHGAIQNYRSSFEISRVNAVRIKRPFFARMLKRSYIEAEVVGIGGEDESSRPMICILSDTADVMRIMENILPEFIYTPEETKKQPPDAKVPMIANAVLAAAAIASVMFISIIMIDSAGILETHELRILEYSLLSIAIIIVIGITAAIVLSMRLRGFETGTDLFSFRNGLLDRETAIINYEKVQIAELRGGIVAKRLGLAKCKISLLSASGANNIRSGYFMEEDLQMIAEKVLEKIRVRLS